MSSSVAPPYAVFESYQPPEPVTANGIEIELANAFDPVRMAKLCPKSGHIPDSFKLTVGIPLMRAGKVVAFTNGGFNKVGDRLMGMTQLLGDSFYRELEVYKETLVD